MKKIDILLDGNNTSTGVVLEHFMRLRIHIKNTHSLYSTGDLGSMLDCFRSQLPFNLAQGVGALDYFLNETA